MGKLRDVIYFQITNTNLRPTRAQVKKQAGVPTCLPEVRR